VVGKLGDDLGLSRAQAARGIFRVTETGGGGATTDRGVDWRGMPLFGPAARGPVTPAVAALLESSRIAPPQPSVVGLRYLVTSVRFDLVRSDLRVNELDWARVDRDPRRAGTCGWP
jgi:N-methylhydantoinase A